MSEPRFFMDEAPLFLDNPVYTKRVRELYAQWQLPCDDKTGLPFDTSTEALYQEAARLLQNACVPLAALATAVPLFHHSLREAEAVLRLLVATKHALEGVRP